MYPLGKLPRLHSPESIYQAEQTDMKSFNYIILLLNSQQNQGIALLETASPQQVLDQAKGLYNLKANTDLLQPKSKSLLLKNKKVIEKLRNKKISEIGKYRIIRNNAKTIYQL